MSYRAASRNNVLAGLFLVVSVILAVAVSFVLSDAELSMKREYIVEFSLADGASGIKKGSPVDLGGQQVGKVEGVELHSVDGVPDAVHVRIKIRADVKLYENAWVMLELPLLGTLSSINIPFVGTPDQQGPHQGASNQLEPGESIRGSIAPPAFLAQAGFGPEERDRIKRVIVDVENAVETVSDIVERVDAQVDPAVDDVRAALRNAREVTDDIRGKVPGWTDDIDSTLASARSGSEKFDGIMDDGKAAVSGVRGMIDDNRPKVDETVENARQITARVKDESVVLLNDTLTEARKGAEEFTKLADVVSTTVVEERPTIARIFANARLATDQLKLATIEIRQQPWRLLYRPKTKELQEQVFYDAARTYAEAVSDLRAASASLEAASAASPTLPIDRATLEDMTRRLSEAFAKYQEAESKLMERMSKEPRLGP